MNSAKKQRNASLELLRIITMVLIIVLHGLDKGGLLKIYAGTGNHIYQQSWILNAFCLSSVNVYILLTGYFMSGSNAKVSRFLEIVFTVLFYSIGILGVMLLLTKGLHLFDINSLVINDQDTGVLSVYTYLRCLFPLHMDTYWFCTSYVVFYLFLPVLSAGVKNLSKKGLETVIVLLLIFESLFKTVCPFTFEIDDKGGSPLWFMTLFFVAAYVRLYGIKLINTAWKGFVLFLAGETLVFSEEFVIQFVFVKTGRFGLLERISYDHNHLFMLMGALGLFMCFVNMKPITGKSAKVINRLATASFSTYLIHEQILIRFNWPKWLGVGRFIDLNPIVFAPVIILTGVLVYLICFLLDSIRQLIFAFIAKCMSKSKLSSKIADLDKQLAATETTE